MESFKVFLVSLFIMFTVNISVLADDYPSQPQQIVYRDINLEIVYNCERTSTVNNKLKKYGYKRLGKSYTEVVISNINMSAMLSFEVNDFGDTLVYIHMVNNYSCLIMGGENFKIGNISLFTREH